MIRVGLLNDTMLHSITILIFSLAHVSLPLLLHVVPGLDVAVERGILVRHLVGDVDVLEGQVEEEGAAVRGVNSTLVAKEIHSVVGEEVLRDITISIEDKETFDIFENV